MTDPILQKILQLREIGLKFDILVVRSEQKQQSLGTGKFAAGSSFLITDDPIRRKLFDQVAKMPRTMDQQLATFYRENLSQEVIELVKEQIEVAKKFVLKNKMTPRKNSKMIANGPFVFERTDENNPVQSDNQEGYSFGFVVKNWTSWQQDQRRIDPGLESESLHQHSFNVN